MKAVSSLDQSIEIEPIRNSVDFESIKNSVDVQLVKVESIYEFVTPAQVVIEKKEVG
jgi:hypothetical protein